MRLLTLDIETAPNLVHVWRLWKQNVGLNQIIQDGYVLCWAAKFYNEDTTYFAGLNGFTKKQMLEGIWNLLNEADVVCHYNGKKFDIPTLNAEFLEEGFAPPKPYKQIDLLQTVRSQFNFPSNKLAYVAPRLGCGKKVAHAGHELWIKCMANDPDAWAKMEEYNRGDVELTEELYEKLLPWVQGHPNPAIFDDEQEIKCRCGSKNYVKEGFAKTQVGRYQQYRCKDCGSWFRGGKNLALSKNVARNVV